MTEPLLLLQNAVLKRGRFVSAPLSFAVHAGEKRLLLGSNGCGKTSLLLSIAGLLPVHDGVLKRQQHCALSTGQLHPTPEWTVAEILFDGLGARAESALDFWQLKTVASRRLASLSLGFQQRVSLALATFSEAPLILLDEPSNGLDPVQTETLHHWLDHDTSHTVLLVSHQPKRLPTCVNKALLLSEQGVLFDGARTDLPAPWQD